MSPYTINKNNPIIFSDPNGDIAGDYYKKTGKKTEKIGTDGKTDGKNYLLKDDAKYSLNDKSEITIKSGGTVNLPPDYALPTMYEAYSRTRKPTPEGAVAEEHRDKIGNFHEEGGIFGLFKNPDDPNKPLQRAYLADPGEFADPSSKDGQASVEVSNFNEFMNLKTTEGRFHTHPGGVHCVGCEIPDDHKTGPYFVDDPQGSVLKTVNTSSNIGAVYSKFGTAPSSTDYLNAKTWADPKYKNQSQYFTGNSYVISIRDKMLYIYDANKNLYSIPLLKDDFGNVGIFDKVNPK